jgi:hypothetical protein
MLELWKEGNYDLQRSGFVLEGGSLSPRDSSLAEPMTLLGIYSRYSMLMVPKRERKGAPSEGSLPRNPHEVLLNTSQFIVLSMDTDDRKSKPSFHSSIRGGFRLLMKATTRGKGYPFGK